MTTASHDQTMASDRHRPLQPVQRTKDLANAIIHMGDIRRLPSATQTILVNALLDGCLSVHEWNQKQIDLRRLQPRDEARFADFGNLIKDLLNPERLPDSWTAGQHLNRMSPVDRGNVLGAMRQELTKSMFALREQMTSAASTPNQQEHAAETMRMLSEYRRRL